jgi:hypothetical protein
MLMVRMSTCLRTYFAVLGSSLLRVFAKLSWVYFLKHDFLRWREIYVSHYLIIFFLYLFDVCEDKVQVPFQHLFSFNL